MTHHKSVPVNYSALPGALLHVCPAEKYSAAQRYEPSVPEAIGGLGGTDLLLLIIYSSGPMGLWVIPHNDQS